METPMIKPFFVIARYNEDVSWLSQREYFNNGVIYNKGPDDISYDGQIIKSSNYPDWGRESETYIRFILDNYNNLPSYIVFTQADPFDHSPYFLEIVDILNNENKWKDYQVLTSGCYRSVGKSKCGYNAIFNDLGMVESVDQAPPPNNILYDKTEYIDQYPLYFEVIDRSMLPISFEDLPGKIYLDSFRKQENIFWPHNTLARTYKKLGLNKPFCGYAKFNYGAIFGVKKENILQHSTDFYKNLHNFAIQTPVHGYILERMWYTILN
jgi:hypothetical protein